MAIAAAVVAAPSAHRRDEYLQAARLAIEPDRVEVQLDLTPGIALAARVIDEIDRNHDGVVSEDETRAYAASVQHDIALAVDGRVLPLELRDSRAATAESMTNGEGTLHLQWQAALPPLRSGTHYVTFRNGHHTDIGVYLANVVVPSSERVAVTAQDRDVDQREFVVRYDLRGAPGGSRLPWIAIAGLLTAAVGAGRFRMR